jgi:hypothetical protein
MDQTEIEKLLNQLIGAGENAEEMEHWRRLYPFMTENEKLKLDENLLKTLATRQS